VTKREDKRVEERKLRDGIWRSQTKVKERNGRKEHAEGGVETARREKWRKCGKPERIRVTSFPCVRQEYARDSLVNLSSKHIVRA